MNFEVFPLFPALALVVVAAFFSASETAFFSLSRFQLRQLKQKNPERFLRIRFLLDRPAALVATILLGNELTNVFISNLLANYYEDQNFSPLWVTILNLVTVLPVIMILGEITPKVIGAKSSLAVSYHFLPPLWWFYKLSFPIRFLLESTVELLTRPIRRKQPKRRDHIREDDILQLLEDGKNKGTIQSVEQEIIENLFEIDDDKVIEIATPLSECLVVRQDDSPKSAIDKINRNFYPRIPVIGDHPDRVVGILYAKDLLNYITRDESEMKVRNLMKEPLFVNSQMKVEVLFRRFRQLKRHIAVIEDANGKSIGVVTMEDILDQMFGELWVDSK